MAGCIFESASLEQTVRQFGGKVFRANLTRIYAERLRHHRQPVDIRLEKVKKAKKEQEAQSLMLTGANGSGKTSLIEGIRHAFKKLLNLSKTLPDGTDAITTIRLYFDGDEKTGFRNTFRKEVSSGQYIFIHLDATHLLHEEKTGFWEYLDKTQAAINQAELDGKTEKAKSLRNWISYVQDVLKELLADEDTKLRYNPANLCFELWQGKKLHDREALPLIYLRSCCVNGIATIYGRTECMALF